MRGTGAALLLSLTALNARADYASTVSGFTPVGYWRFNETATAPAQNSVSNASTMGSVLNGYVVRDVVKGEPGKVGTSVRLTNPSVAAGYCGSKIDVPFNYALNVAGAFSVEFWLKAASLGADATGMAIVSSMMQDFAASSRTGFLIYLNSAGRLEFRQGNASGYVGTMNNLASLPGHAMNTSVFRHVVCSFDGTVSRIYVDGSLSASFTLSAEIGRASCRERVYSSV